MSKAALLSTAALVLAATAADARPQIIPSRDNRTVTIVPDTTSLHANRFVPGTYLYTNFALKEKEGVYLAAYQFTISGPSSFFGVAYGIAEQFKLKENASITSLTAATGYVSGDQAVTMTLYADNGHNSPGAVLASGTTTITTESGSCCGVTSVGIAATNLRAGKPYWIAITTTGSNFETTAPEIADQVDEVAYESFTTDGGNTWSAGSKVFGSSLPAIGIK